jgi:DNA invertase Pin-like site-specific DNA recombinase
MEYNRMEKLFLYCRVSTDLQVEKKTQNNQKTAIMDFLKDFDVEIVHIFEDLGLSGADKNREQFIAMIARLNEVNGIAVFDLDRLSREMQIGLDLMKILIEKKIKIYEARTKTIKDLARSDIDQLLYFISMWHSADERKKIHDRQALGIERYKSEKGRWGRKRKPFNLKKYLELIEMGLAKTSIAKIMGLHIQTLYARLKENKIPVGPSIKKGVKTNV